MVVSGPAINRDREGTTMSISASTPATLSPVPSSSDGATGPGAGLRAVVTGASSGIGAATVRRLRADGWQVVAVARRADRLAALAQETGAQAVVADITSDEDVARLVREVDAGGPLHALVNNAGGALGTDPVATGSIDQWRTMYETNVLGTLRVTQALLPALRAGGRGDVLVLTSTAAHDTYPGGGGYVAAKHAERQIATTLRLELVGEPIRVLEVAPGMVHTDEFSLRRFGGDQARADAVYEGVVGGPLVADDIADAIAWVLTRPHHVNIDLLLIRPRAQASNTLVARG
jgi:NADP-dependent 3-hydroxy acid dehydrogenase YdfG